MTKLNTLKDFHIGSLGGFGFPKHPIEGNYANDRLFREALKQEAIKHIKKYQKGIKEGSKKSKLKKEIKENIEWYLKGKIAFIKHFFNITKEDLEVEHRK